MKHSHSKQSNSMQSTSIWILLLILANGNMCKNNDIVTNLNLTRYCQNTIFCSQLASSNFSKPGKQACCSSCLCTNDCHMYGNCCPDVERQVYYKYLMPECFFPVYNIDFETQDLYDNYIFAGINSYNAFVKCPESYKNDTVRDMCEGIPNRLEDFALVSNEQGYVYKNKHCASCHGIDKFLSWSLKMKCQTSENAEKFLNELPFVKNDTCMIWSFPQRSQVGRRSICFKAKGDCEKHGSLREACLSYTLYYFHDFRGLTFLFKNVHCFACTHSESFLKGTCALMTTEGDLKLYPSLLPITAILDIDINGDTTQPSKLSTKVNTCSKSEVYDSFFNKCRALNCPVISNALYGKCFSYYSNIFGFSVSILVEFQSVLNKAEFTAVKTLFDQSDQSEYSRFYTDIVTAFIKSTKQSMKECGICETKVIENGTLMYFYIIFHTNNRCTVNDLYFNVYKYAQKSRRFHVSIDSKPFAFITEVRFKKVETIEDIERMITKFRLKITICDNPIPYNGDLVCPKITLNKTEYNYVMTKGGDYNGKVLEKEIQHFPKNIESNNESKTVSTRNVRKKITQEYDVCWNDYQVFINSGNTVSKLDWLGIIRAALHGLLMLLSPIQYVRVQ